MWILIYHPEKKRYKGDLIFFQIWELETGKRVGTINNAHDDNVEVTALCLDKSGYRMATGGFDGEFVISKNRCMIV